MSDNLSSSPELESNAVSNQQIKGVSHAKDPNYFPTINMALGKPNVTLQFKCDLGKKNLYTIKSKDWNPTHQKTLDIWERHEKTYKPSPNEIAEQMTLDQHAKYPDGTYKYYKSYKTFKRLRGSDGAEYLVRTGYLHGISFMNIEWKYPKNNFDWHYEPVFDVKAGGQSTSYNPVYGEQVNQIKVYHSTWDPIEFDKALRDIPFPKNTSIGVSFKVGVEGAMGVTTIPTLEVFRNKSFDDLYAYARTGDRSYLEFTEEEKKAMTATIKKK